MRALWALVEPCSGDDPTKKHIDYMHLMALCVLNFYSLCDLCDRPQPLWSIIDTWTASLNFNSAHTLHVTRHDGRETARGDMFLGPCWGLHGLFGCVWAMLCDSLNKLPKV